MKTIDDFIANLPEDERPIAETLREIILDTLPGIREKLSYGVPYFYLKSRICFIWPASAPMGGDYEGVMLGFCKANLLSNEQGLLDMGARKEVGVVIFKNLKAIDEEILREVLLEAALVDRM